MNDRTSLSTDDFVASFGSGSVTETESETTETTQNIPTDDEAPENVSAEREVEGDEELPNTEAAEEGEDDVETDETEETDADAEDEESKADEDTDEEVEDVEDKDSDEDDEEVLEETFQWNDALEVEVPGIGKTTLEELRRGNLREADFIRKTQEVSALKRETTQRAEAKEKALDDERQLLTQRREALDATLDVMRQEMSQSDPNWGELASEDQGEYIRQMELKRQRDERLKKIEGDVAAARAEEEKTARAKEDELRLKQEDVIREQQSQLFEKMPDWRDQKSFGEAMKGLADMIEPFGFSLDDLNNTVDHRQLVLLQGFKDAQGEIARLKTDLGKMKKKATRVEKAKPALKKKVQASSKRIKPVSSAPAEPKDKAVAFLDKVKKQNGGTMTAKDFAQYTVLGGR